MRYLAYISFLFFFYFISYSSYSFTNSNYDSGGTVIDNFNRVAEHNSLIYKVENDTLSEANTIERIWFDQTNYNVDVRLDEGGNLIRLAVFNMLGKEVLEVYEGVQANLKSQYSFNGDRLPPGIYFCVLTGNGLKDARKFIVTR